MSQRFHQRAAELHNLAAHAHSAAVGRPWQEDHLTATNSASRRTSIP